MIEIYNVVLPSAEQWEAVIDGTRNSFESWDKSDSYYGKFDDTYEIGKKDHELLMALAKAGPSHCKYRRMLMVYANISASLTFWKQFDTYRAGVEKNSTSTMHTVMNDEFKLGDFDTSGMTAYGMAKLSEIIYTLNGRRESYKQAAIEADKKAIWQDVINILPESYMQLRTVMFSYEALSNIYHQRKNHKLETWHIFCEWVKTLPYSEFITLETPEDN